MTTYTYTHTHARAHTHTYTRTHAHTHTHTHHHTYIQITVVCLDVRCYTCLLNLYLIAEGFAEGLITQYIGNLTGISHYMFG